MTTKTVEQTTWSAIKNVAHTFKVNNPKTATALKWSGYALLAAGVIVGGKKVLDIVGTKGAVDVATAAAETVVETVTTVV